MRKTRNMNGKWGQKWDAQINAYYDANPEIKTKIKEHLKQARLNADPKDTFRLTVRGIMKTEKLSVKQAIRKTLRTKAFMEKEAILHENAVKGLRGFKDAYNDWRKFTRHQKIDKSKLKYLGDNTYEYDFDNNWIIFIEYKNSPTDAKVWRKHK